MELWIRTQDREKLVKVSEVYVHEFCDEFDSNICRIDSKSYVLGTYKTKERALEILDKIQRELEYNVIATNDDGYVTMLENTKIFEMPKE